MVFDTEGNSLEKYIQDKELVVFDGDGTLSNIFFDSWLFLSRKRGEYLYDQGISIGRKKLEKGKVKISTKENLDIDYLNKEIPYKSERRRMGEQFVNAHNKIYLDYLQEVKAGKSNAYLNMKNKLLKLWTHDGKYPLSRQFIIEDVVGRIPLRRSVIKIIQILKDLGVKVGVITASFDLYAQRLDELLQLDFCISNTTLDFNSQGFLEDFVQKREFEKTKRLELGSVSNKFGIPLSRIIAFGDGETDVDIFWDTTGIAVSSTNQVLLDSSVMAIEGFKPLLMALESLSKKRRCA